MNRNIAFFAFAFLLPNLARADAPAAERPGVVARIQGRAQAKPRARAKDRGELRRFLRKLGASDAQRAVALEQARAAGPIARAARLEGREIRVESRREHPNDREAARAEARERIHDLRERTLASLQPLARKVVATLSPDQRKTLEDAARARGKELDAARLEKLVSWLLTRHGTLAHLQKGERTR
jgi:hypothetical protein